MKAYPPLFTLGARLSLLVLSCLLGGLGAISPSLVRPCSAREPAAAAQRPNIIFILADDVGYGDLSCQGAKHVQTPHLDRLAAAGCRFTDAHSPASTCTPTRRAFLTGVYSWRQAAGATIAPGDAPLTIPPGTTTLPSLLKSAGYRTAVVGKWHLGLGPATGADWNGEIRPGPLDIGFDEAFIMPATGDRVPTVYVRDRHVVGLDPQDPIRISYQQKIGDEPTGKENPDLLKLKHTHGHDMTIVNGVGRIGWMTGGRTARWVDEEMSDRFVTEAIGFVDRHQQQQPQSPFFLYLATHGIHVPRVPHPRFRGTSSCGTRGDAIHELDDAVGKLLATLERLKIADNTLVIFTSDNGGVMDDGYEDVGRTDYHPNAPWRGTKAQLLEGGHRVPFIARWPGHIQAGTTSPALIAHLDFPATLAALTGTPVPAGACRDSVNVLPALLGKSQQGRTHFVAHVGGVRGPFGLRSGAWKYIGGSSRAVSANKNAAPQLYDLANDPGESINLATTQPDKRQELARLLERLISEE
ncbi:MAG: sulfatase family protein [Planctomycetota bacterium]